MAFNTMKHRLWMLSILVLSACDPAAPIRVQNLTNETLEIYISNTLIGQAPPGAIVDNQVIFGRSIYPIKAKDKTGNIVYQHDFTIDELKKTDYLVVIAETG